MTVEEQKERAQVLKETGTFATLWDEYERLRKVCSPETVSIPKIPRTDLMG